MRDHIDELCDLVKSAGGTMRLYGREVSPSELRGAMVARVDAKLGAIVVGLPTPSLSAIIDTSGPGLGVVTVAGYTVDRRDDDQVLAPRRKRIVCARCGVVGHNRNNRRFHARPL